MKKILLVSVITLALSLPAVYAQDKLAQTGFQFLSVGTDAQATAMGEAYTAFGRGAVSMYYNPANMAMMKETLDLNASQMTWIADIKYFSGSVAYRPKRGLYGVFGLSFVSIDYGEFLGTMVATTDAGYEDTGTFSPSAMMMGVSYANQLTDRFSVGGTVKYAYQDLGSHTVAIDPKLGRDETTEDDLRSTAYDLGVMAFDFGTLYRTGFKSLAFGMSVRNFSREIEFEEESFQLPLTFSIGIAFNAFDFLPFQLDDHELNVTVDAAHPRSYPEYISVGGEYSLMRVLALRAGYVGSHDEYGFTAGFGVQKFGIGIHYSYSPFNVFDDVNRVSINVSL